MDFDPREPGPAPNSAQTLMEKFSLQPHPFDGWFAPVEAEAEAPVRFHYLVKAGEFAGWHHANGRLVLTYIDGAPLTVSLSDDTKKTRNSLLRAGPTSSLMIDATTWRTWESMGNWSLMMVSVETSQDFTLWNLAPDDWYPGAASE